MSQRTGDSEKKSEIKRVVDFTQARQQKMDEKRRRTERIFFKHLMGVYTVTGNDKMKPIELVEVSEDGCSFQIPHDSNNPWTVDSAEMPLRLYFSQDTYIPIVVRIANSRPSIDQGVRYVRYGCEVDKTVSSYPAYQQFVKFLEMYSEHAHRDKGDVTLFYL